MKIGVVPYINALPLTYNLPKEHITRLTPADLITALLEDKVDVALLPFFSILKHNLKMHPQAGVIACDGEVKSVGFFTRPYITDLSQIKSIYLDKESLSSAFMAKAVLKKYFGISLYDLEFFHEDNRDLADAQMLIGDKALFFEKKQQYFFWDLGSLWQKHTDSGFLFACWASKNLLSKSSIDLLTQAKTEGLANKEKISCEFDPKIRGIVYDYLMNNIKYKPTERIRKGARLYRDLLKEYRYGEPFKKVA